VIINVHLNVTLMLDTEMSRYFLPRPRWDRHVQQFARDETLARLETVSRLGHRDRNYNPA